MNNDIKYGIDGFKAHELEVDKWIDAHGKPTKPIKLSDFDGKFKVIYCFQSWCPGCHSRGLPALQEMTKALNNNDKVTFMAIQTVFEGFDENTFDKIIKIQEKYGLEIPFGHDTGDDESQNRSRVMQLYRTGGTPWFIFIDQKNNVVFNDFHLNVAKAITFLKTIE
ncbi:MAG: TlpA family protein disulfide reductase [Maribacter sp.]|nr:TlpA family protein disulfide reductase [Maribacter sp.]